MSEHSLFHTNIDRGGIRKYTTTSVDVTLSTFKPVAFSISKVCEIRQLPVWSHTVGGGVGHYTASVPLNISILNCLVTWLYKYLASHLRPNLIWFLSCIHLLFTFSLFYMFIFIILNKAKRIIINKLLSIEYK